MRAIHVRVIQWIVAVCAVVIMLVMAGVIIVQSALKDPGQHELPALFAQVSGMNLNKEESEELETCIQSAKVMYFSQAVKKCVNRARYKN
ncbi:hypothetical protein ACXHVK_001764 [Morganella morganii]|uniref:hypothetical protein n=1 Tax=Morganella morganii TaxID=582 RepID=UPI001BD5E670|nr:hypothetical protein [Morganella morganii]EKK5375948.1 hypothetical protein [Morganella morganii]EKU5842352.1 hypothetical protein [Morganella morganii]EKW7744908.1 hypothetical protein [Morganella morganii]MBS9541611.1 hypothetical protein [Morganella morganii subsp. morganii]HCR3198215.1 hypothetical protein [Morganella morganii]